MFVENPGKERSRDQMKVLLLSAGCLCLDQQEMVSDYFFPFFLSLLNNLPLIG